MAYISFQPSDYFNTKLYTGTGSELTVSGVGFQPDFTWLKNRSATQHHQLYDAVRGAGKVVYTNLDNAEGTVTQNLKSWNSDGFVLGTDGSVNTNNENFASWNWKAGTTSGLTTNGSTTITPSAYSFDATRKVSIIKYTGNGTSGAKLAHGLGVAPEFIMFKYTSDAQHWGAYHHNVGTSATDSAGYKMKLNSTDAKNNDDAFLGDTAPDATNINLGSSSWVNGNTGVFNAWCFAGVKGFSKFGAFHGNGQTGDSAPFIYTGFKPAFVMIKSTASGSWLLFDSKRASTSNIPEGSTGVPSYLEPNTSGTEQGDNPIFLFSNGFQCLDTLTNGDGVKFIFAAWAENPIVGSNGTAGVAR